MPKAKRVKTEADIQKLCDTYSELELPKLLEMVQTLQTSLVRQLEEERSTTLSEVEIDRMRLIKEQKEWERLSKKLKATQLPEYIRLNVGGVVFASSRVNLKKYENSFFSALLSGRWEANLKEDVFIDRSPALFGRVIDFLRGDETVAQDLNDMDRERLAIEADFYQLNELKRLCYYLEPMKGELELSDDKRSIRSIRQKVPYGYHKDRKGLAIVRPKIQMPLKAAFVEQSFKIDLGEGDVLIGVCTENELKTLRKSTPLQPFLRSQIRSISRLTRLKGFTSADRITVRVFDNCKVQWTICTKANLRIEEVLASHQMYETKPLFFVVYFANSSAHVELDEIQKEN